MNELNRKQLIEMNDELMKNCEAYKWAWERCLKQMKESEVEKDVFCKNLILKIIDELNTDSEALNGFVSLLEIISDYRRK